MIGRTNVSGVDMLNYQVIGGTQVPANPKENTIWVNTSNMVSGYVFADELPDSVNAENGLVWVVTGIPNSVEFNAVKENGIYIRILAVKQYVGGVWTKKPAKVFQGGAWVDVIYYLFKNGKVNTGLVGGIRGTNDGTRLVFDNEISPGKNLTYTTTKKVDLTNVNKIHIKFVSPRTTTYIYLRLLICGSSYNGTNVTSSGVVKSAMEASPYTNDYQELVLDVSDVSGEYYIGYAWGVLSDCGYNRDIIGYIYEWWLE